VFAKISVYCDSLKNCYIAKFSSFYGVAILFRNSFEFKIHDEVRDTLGNYDISIQDYRMTLAAVYGPNEDKPCFFETLQSKINIFPNSSLILVGDWNVVQDYNLDTINYRRENNSNSKLKLHSMMNDLDLINGQIDDRWINNLNARIGIRVIN
jgi:hypothetical protein